MGDERTTKGEAHRDLPALTGLRFVAAEAVVFFHFVRWRFDASGWARRFFSCGFLAVGLFFVLSGFILAHAHRGEPFRTRSSRRRFWRDRFARIYPTYALGMLSGAWVVHSLGWIHGREFASATGVLRIAAVVLVLPGLGHRTMFLFNWAAWSLTCEVLFYASFPLVFPWFARRSSRELLVLACGLSFVTWAAPVIYGALDPDALGRPLRLGDETVVYGHYVKLFPLFHVHEFAWGIVGCAAWRRGDVLAGVGPRGRALVIVGCVGVVWAAAFVLLDRAYLFLHCGLAAPLFATLVAVLADDADPISRVLSARPFVLLGRASYVTYMIHVPLYLWMSHVFEARLGAVRLTFVYLAVLAAGSLGIHFAWERPLRRALRGRA